MFAFKLQLFTGTNVWLCCCWIAPKAKAENKAQSAKPKTIKSSFVDVFVWDLNVDVSDGDE